MRVETEAYGLVDSSVTKEDDPVGSSHSLEDHTLWK
jgi:hypothetical protein